MQKKLETTCVMLRRHSLLIAISGGSDSTALAYLAYLAKTEFRLVYVHHHLRPNADQEAKFVTKLGEKWHVETEILHVNGEKIREDPRGIEAAAREARYRVLAQELGEKELLVTAHTANDRLETLLLRITQGSGIRGIAGPLSKHKIAGIPVWRPILHWWREELKTLLHNAEITWCIDESNAEDRFLRNRLRHHVSKPWRKIADQRVLLRSLEQLQTDALLYLTWITEACDEVTLSLSPKKIILDRKLLASHSNRLIQAILHETIDRLESARASQKQFQSWAKWVPKSGSYVGLAHRVRIVFAEQIFFSVQLDPRKTPEITPFLPQILPKKGSIICRNWIIQVEHCSENNRTENGSCFWFDSDQLAYPLLVREAQTEDCFIPFGANSEQMVKKRLKKDGWSSYKRKKACVIVDAKNRLLLIVGSRRSSIARLENAPKSVLQITLSKQVGVT